MPDPWTEDMHRDVPTTLPAAQQEIRRLRAALRNVELHLRGGLESRDWHQLRQAAERALEYAARPSTR